MAAAFLSDLAYRGVKFSCSTACIPNQKTEKSHSTGEGASRKEYADAAKMWAEVVVWPVSLVGGGGRAYG